MGNKQDKIHKRESLEQRNDKTGRYVGPRILTLTFLQIYVPQVKQHACFSTIPGLTRDKKTTQSTNCS